MGFIVCKRRVNRLELFAIVCKRLEAPSQPSVVAEVPDSVAAAILAVLLSLVCSVEMDRVIWEKRVVY